MESGPSATRAMKRAKRETRRQRKDRERGVGGGDLREPRSFQPFDPSHLRSQLKGIANDVARALKQKTRSAATAAAGVAEAATESAIATALQQTRERPACGAGCSYCCRGVRVDVTVPEVARIVDYLEQNVSEEIRYAFGLTRS